MSSFPPLPHNDLSDNEKYVMWRSINEYLSSLALESLNPINFFLSADSNYVQISRSLIEAMNSEYPPLQSAACCACTSVLQLACGSRDIDVSTLAFQPDLCQAYPLVGALFPPKKTCSNVSIPDCVPCIPTLDVDQLLVCLMKCIESQEIVVKTSAHVAIGKLAVSSLYLARCLARKGASLAVLYATDPFLRHKREEPLDHLLSLEQKKFILPEIDFSNEGDFNLERIMHIYMTTIFIHTLKCFTIAAIEIERTTDEFKDENFPSIHIGSLGRLLDFDPSDTAVIFHRYSPIAGSVSVLLDDDELQLYLGGGWGSHFVETTRPIENWLESVDLDAWYLKMMVASAVLAEGPFQLLQMREECQESVVDDKVARCLLIGLGGGLLAWYFQMFAPNCLIDVVEIDPHVAQCAEQFFYFDKTPNTRIFIADIADFVNSDAWHSFNNGQSNCNHTKKVISDSIYRYYDFISLDVYSAASFPNHIITKQFFELVSTMLFPTGVFVINVGVQMPGLGTVQNLISGCFPSVLSFPCPLHDEDSILLLASKHPISLSAWVESLAELPILSPKQMFHAAHAPVSQETTPEKAEEILQEMNCLSIANATKDGPIEIVGHVQTISEHVIREDGSVTFTPSRDHSTGFKTDMVKRMTNRKILQAISFDAIEMIVKAESGIIDMTTDRL